MYHTSYALLFFVLVVTGFTLIFARQQAAQAGPPQTQNGNITVTGIVPGPPPTIPAVINQPSNGQEFTDNTITISGTCEATYIVEIYRNAVFAGSDVCSGSSTFSLQISLVSGENILVVRTKDSFDQYGPDSQSVTVSFRLPESAGSDSGSQDDDGDADISGNGASPGSGTGTSPLLVQSASVHTGAKVGEVFTLIYTVKGGEPPYALGIDWGYGGEDDLRPHPKADSYKARHTYDLPGEYRVILRAMDNKQQTALLQIIVIVQGEIETSSPLSFIATGCGQKNTSDPLICSAINVLNRVWPVFLLASSLAISFWLGEKAVYWRLHHNFSRVAK